MDNGRGGVCRRERQNNGAGMIMDEELDLLEHLSIPPITTAAARRRHE
jgi:hypothetical protein